MATAESAEVIGRRVDERDDSAVKVRAHLAHDPQALRHAPAP